MNKEEHKQYSKEYRMEGFGRLSDAKHNAKRKDRKNAYMREYYKKHRDKMLAYAKTKRKDR